MRASPCSTSAPTVRCRARRGDPRSSARSPSAWPSGLLLAALSCRQSPYEEAPESIPSEPLAPLWEVWSILQEGFVDRDTMDPDRLSLGAVEEMAVATPDAEDDAAALEPEPRYSLPDGAPEEARVRVGTRGRRSSSAPRAQGTTPPDPSRTRPGGPYAASSRPWAMSTRRTSRRTASSSKPKPLTAATRASAPRSTTEAASSS